MATLLLRNLDLDGAAGTARDHHLRRTLAVSSVEGVAAEVVGACVGGGVLLSWALRLGGGSLLVVLLSALASFAQLAQLPAAWFSAVRGRRTLAISATAVARLSYLALAALPFVHASAAVQRAVLVAVATVASVAGVIGNNAWLSWMGDLVPEQIRGRYFARRSGLCTLGGAAMSLVAGLSLDAAGVSRAQPVLAALAVVAAAVGALSVWLMAQQHEPSSPRRAPPGGPKAVFAPLTNPNTRALVTYQLAWNAAVGLAASLFGVHMLANLRLRFAVVAIHSACFALARMASGTLWGRAIDRFGARPVLLVCSFGAAAVPLLWLLPTPGHVLVTLVLDVLLSGALSSGHALASFALPLATAPREQRSQQVALCAAAGGVAFAVAAVAGGILAAALPAHLTVGGLRGYGVHALFVLSAGARLGAALLGRRIDEPGARSVRALLTQSAA